MWKGVANVSQVPHTSPRVCILRQVKGIPTKPLDGFRNYLAGTRPVKTEANQTERVLRKADKKRVQEEDVIESATSPDACPMRVMKQWEAT